MKKCVECGFRGGLGRTTVRHVLECGDRTFAATIPAFKCSKCGETYTEAVDHARAQLEAARRLADAGEVNGAGFRFMRHALGMRALQLAQLLGVAAETVSRWETGGRDVDKLAWATIGALVTDRLGERTTTETHLRAIQSPKPLAKTVRLEVTATTDAAE